jgi:CRISPR-associated protein Cmr5
MLGTNIQRIEKGKATFAYECAKQNLTMTAFEYNGQRVNFDELFQNAFEKKLDKKLKDSQTNKDFLTSFLKKAEQTAKDWQKEERNFKADVVTYYHKYGKEYKAYAKKIPMLIKTNGLGATYAFIKSKGKNEGTPYDLLYNQTHKWLQMSQCPFIALTDKDDLVEKIIGLPSNEYRAVTNEVISLFTWLRRFAEGLIEGEDEQTD